MLDAHGQQLYILELQGFIFFGTANSLYEHVTKRVLDQTLPQARFVVLDFLRVTGLDSTGLLSFDKLLDLLSGGTISNFSILAMGVYPYITAQIIIQLLVPIFPALQRRMQEDPREGRKLQERWTYYLAVPMAALSAIGQINIFNSMTSGGQVVPFGFTQELWLPSVAILLSMVSGTMFAIWLGELISEFGVRKQGLSLIIFSGIVAQIPQTW